MLYVLRIYIHLFESITVRIKYIYCVCFVSLLMYNAYMIYK